MEQSNLKPCPFCGKVPRLLRVRASDTERSFCKEHWLVVCRSNCYNTIVNLDEYQKSTVFWSEKFVTDVWNNRTEEKGEEHA